MNSKNNLIYLDRLTKSISHEHHKRINEILLSDSITVIYNKLLPSLPRRVLKNLYLNIKNNLKLFSPEQIEKLKPIVTFYTNIKFPCSTQCNPVNNPDRSRLRDKEYGTKRDCLSKCDKKVSIDDESLLLTVSFLSFEDKLKYLIGVNRKELIKKVQERDIYNPEIIIKEESSLEIQFRPYVIITYDSYYEANPDEYKNIKYLNKTLISEEAKYDVIYEAYNNKETIVKIEYKKEYEHTGAHLVLNGKPLTKKETIYLKYLDLGDYKRNLGDSLSNLTQLENLNLEQYNHPLGDSLTKLTQLKELNLEDYDQPLGDSLSKLTLLKDLNLKSYNHPPGDSLLNLTQLIDLNLKSYNKPLGDSLSKLTHLKELNLKSYSRLLGDSLSKLTLLKKLSLDHFNLPLGDSLSTLTQLKELNLKYYNKPLEDSLSTLTQLKELNLGAYNKPLGNTAQYSLSKLTLLKKLSLNSFNNPLGDSLSKLTHLKELNLGAYNHPLGNSLLNLTQLKELNLSAYNHPLGDSLSKLTLLKELNLAFYISNPLGNSLSKLTLLEKLNLNGYYKHPLGNSLSKLTELKELTLKSRLIKSDFGRTFFSFTRKNSVDKNTKKELRDMDFDQLKQRIKDLRREGYKISILSKLEDKDSNRKLLRKIIRETEKG